jgi:outer membrane protein W
MQTTKYYFVLFSKLLIKTKEENMKRYIILFAMLIVIIAANNSYSQLRLSLQGGIQAPTGEFGNTAATGFGGAATFEYWQNTPLSFTASAGYFAWEQQGNVPAGHTYSFSTIPIMLGMRYYLGRGDFHPYLGSELGLHLLNAKQTITSGNTTTTTTTSESNFGISPMAGFRYHVGNRVDLDINMKYNIVSSELNNRNFLGFNFGVQFGL